MIKFKEDESLGKTVKSTRLFCAIGCEPLTRLFQLRFAGGGNKFSQLCGFMFDSANPNQQFPRFAIAFVCKLRSRIYRQQNTNPSQWFIFKMIDKNHVDVLDKKALLVNYGFDVDKFFDSDLFSKAKPRFESTLTKALEDAEKFKETLKSSSEQGEADRFINAIREAIPLMMKSTTVNNKYYQLKDLSALDKEVSKAVSAEIKQKALDAKLKMIKKGNDAFLKKVAAQSAGREPDQIEDSEKQKLDEMGFNKYDWKDGSITGEGLIKMITDCDTWNAKKSPLRIYDRKLNAYFNIVDSHIAKNNGGLAVEIDTSKPVLENEEQQKNETDDAKDEKTESKDSELDSAIKEALTDIYGETI